MKNILFLISIVFLFSCEEIEDFFTPFYLAENGVTVKAKDWVTAGTTGELNGITKEMSIFIRTNIFKISYYLCSSN